MLTQNQRSIRAISRISLSLYANTNIDLNLNLANIYIYIYCFFLVTRMTLFDVLFLSAVMTHRIGVCACALAFQRRGVPTARCPGLDESDEPRDARRRASQME